MSMTGREDYTNVALKRPITGGFCGAIIHHPRNKTAAHRRPRHPPWFVSP